MKSSFIHSGYIYQILKLVWLRETYMKKKNKRNQEEDKWDHPVFKRGFFWLAMVWKLWFQQHMGEAVDSQPELRARGDHIRDSCSNRHRTDPREDKKCTKQSEAWAFVALGFMFYEHNMVKVCWLIRGSIIDSL